MWCVLLAVYVIAGANLVPFHGDESTLIYMGRDSYYQFIDRDISKIYYDDTGTVSPTEQQLRLINGTIPKYIYGFVAINNGYTIEEINEQWDWGADYIYNQDTNRLPDEQLLSASRIVSSIQFALALIALFAVGRIIFNRPIAYMATLYIFLNPNLLINTRRAMMEGSHILGLALLVLIAVWTIRERKWWQYILLGIIAGFAVASKHPNAIINGLIFISIFTFVGWQAIRSKASIIAQTTRTMVDLCIAGLFTVGIFWLLNPALWRKPIAGIQESLSLRNDLLQLQSNAFNSYTSLGERLSGFFDFIFVATPQYFEVDQWATYPVISAQIGVYEQSILSGVAVGGSIIGGLVVMLLTVFGLIHFARNTQFSLEHRWLLTVVGGGICIITFILTPLTWGRYYLPIFPFVGFYLAYAVYTLTATIWKRYTV